MKQYTTYLPKSKVNIIVQCDDAVLVDMAMAEAAIIYNRMVDAANRTDGDVLQVVKCKNASGNEELRYSISNVVKQSALWDSQLDEAFEQATALVGNELNEKQRKVVLAQFTKKNGQRPS